jgi:cytochrome c-type biogenesis protein
MELALAAVFAGIFSALAPCVLPLLPVLLGSQTSGGTRRVLAVLAGLSTSIIVFSVLLKSTTLLIDIPPQTWQLIGGGVIVFFGLSLAMPQWWEWVMTTSRLALVAQRTVATPSTTPTMWGDFLLGASLGPLFNVCSPTYALIVATILPAQPLTGLFLLLIYLLGLTGMLFLIAMFGRSLTQKLGWALNPEGVFRRSLGVILVCLGLLIIFGIDKNLQTWLVESGAFDWQVQLESLLAG